MTVRDLIEALKAVPPDHDVEILEGICGPGESEVSGDRYLRPNGVGVLASAPLVLIGAHPRPVKPPRVDPPAR